LWGRPPLTAALTRKFDSLVVTHPFHPLAGQRLEILFERRLQVKQQRVYVCDGGALGTLYLPEGFTDRADPPAPQLLSVDILTRLAALIAALQALQEPIDITKGKV
jgi:hypothetical protein